MYHNKKSTQGGTLDSSTQVWPAHHNLGVVDYKALTGLSLIQVPHFCASCGALLKALNLDTMSVSKTKCSLVSQWNTRKHTNVGNWLELRVARVTYRVRQITHRATTKNKRHQVIVTMHTSKLKMNTRIKHIRTRTQSLRKVKIQELTDLWDYFRSSNECLTRLSTSDRGSPYYY
jgi:hypothetical protein